MAVTITKGKNNAINKLTADLEQIFNNLNISHKLNFKLFKEILFLSKDYKVFLSVGLEEDIFNDTKILQTIYPIEKYAIRFINFGNVMNLINGFSSMYEFLTDEENNQNYKFINEKSKEKHLAIEPHKNNLFAITQKVPYTESKKDKYENLLFYIYKYIEGYFLKEELLNLVNDNLKFNNEIDFSIKLETISDDTNILSFFKEMALLISNDYENILKNSSVVLRDNDNIRFELDQTLKLRD